MNKYEINQLNPTEAIIDSLPMIVEAFVSFYGEEEREKITNKFQNMLVIGYTTPSQLSILLLSFSNEKSQEITNDFLNKIVPDSDDKEKWKNFLLGTSGFKYTSLHPISNYVDYLSRNNISEYQKKEVVEFLKQIYPEVTVDNLDDLIKQGKFQEIDDMLPSYMDACEEYKNFEKQLEPYDNYVSKCKEIETKITNKYILQFVDELKDLFTDEEYKEIKETELYSMYSIQRVSGKTKNYIGHSLNGTALIDAFSEENDMLLIEGVSWKVNSIKKDRIEYFKNLGIDLGNNYEDYVTNPEVQALMPTKELVNRIISTRETIYTRFMNEYCVSLPEFKKNQARIDELRLLDKNTGYDANLYNRTGTCILTNFRQMNGSPVEYPLLCLGIKAGNNYADANLAHELNHLYELHLTNFNSGKYKMICGWDDVSGEITTADIEMVSLEERENRNYELFNEIVNELIAQEICQIMSDMGIYIFNNPENKKIRGGTSYESASFLVREFYNTYKKEIIESRKNGNMSVMLDAVGKENFEALNQLFHEFKENFNEFSLHTAIKGLQEGSEDEKTTKLRELLIKRDAVLNNMNEYYQSKSVVSEQKGENI